MYRTFACSANSAPYKTGVTSDEIAHAYRLPCPAAGLGIAPASQALDLGNLAGGLVNLAKAATLSDDDAKELAFDAAQHMDSQNKIARPTALTPSAWRAL